MSNGRQNQAPIPGTAMAVIIGFGSVAGALLVPGIDFGSRLILFVLGVIAFWAGVYHST